MVRKREQIILDHIRHVGKATYDELAHILKVSTMTVRRDITRMADEGRITKTLKGAQRIADDDLDLLETQLALRLSEHVAEKRALARVALEMIHNGQTLFLDGSTTCGELAVLLGQDGQGLTVITNSLLVAQKLRRNRDNTLVLVGGRFDFDTYTFVGPSAEEQIRQYFVDLSFMSTRGFVPTEGTYESSVDSFRIKQGIVKQSRQSVLMVDHSKFGRRALSKVLNIEQIDTIITDDQTPSDQLVSLREKGKTVLLATGFKPNFEDNKSTN
ncbi:MAG: DeoR/GlpR transcriptional regulator [Sedimentisphaerales bacterium]|nr:DeoR/GlpR transcriptional regulator [Sedimentisphaerales bacterium]